MGFSADWLALREPADRAARDEALLRQAAAAAGPDPVILDLGCGTGATVRALGPHLDGRAQWRLLDNDPDLLNLAASDPASEPILADLAEIDALPLDGVTLVTTSALLDLVSESWLAALAQRLDTPFYAALSYDGVMRWAPEDPRDAAITAAFNSHQRTDKGFGPALGPDAAPKAQTVLTRAGFDVHSADSPWRLTPDMAALQSALVDGIAQATAEAGAPEAQDWCDTRRAAAGQSTCIIGHQDILAIPRNGSPGPAHAAS